MPSNSKKLKKPKIDSDSSDIVVSLSTVNKENITLFNKFILSKEQAIKIQHVKELQRFIETNIPGSVDYVPQFDADFDHVKLRQLIFTGLETQINDLFSNIKTKLVNESKKKLHSDHHKAITAAECKTDEGIQSLPISFKNIKIELLFTDTLTKTGKTRNARVSLEDLCKNIRTCKQALTTTMGDIDLIVSQSLFIQVYLENILKHTTMNVSTARALFETLSPTEQCDISEKIAWPEDTPDPPSRFDDKFKWIKYCYICGHLITNQNSQCEHILFVSQACAVNCFIQKGNMDNITGMDSLSKKLLKLAYAGADPCCNILKSDTPFIDITDKEPYATANLKNVKAVLRAIKAKAADTNSHLKCHELLDDEHKSPKSWTDEDIERHVNRINDDFLQPLVTELKARLRPVPDSTNPYNAKGVLQLYIRMNQLKSLEVSLEQVICCILTNGAVQLPTRFTRVQISPLIRRIKKTVSDPTTVSDSAKNSNFYLDTAFTNITKVKEILLRTKELLNSKIQHRGSSRPRSRSPFSESAHAKSAPGILQTQQVKPMGETDHPEDSLKKLLLDARALTSFNVVMYNKFFNHDELQDDIFNPTNTYNAPTPSNMFNTGEQYIPAKLTYYFENLKAMFYSISSYGFTSEANVFERLCQHYIALEFIYMLTYNESTTVATAKDTLQSCVTTYYELYKDFVVRWFFYRSIDIILISGADSLFKAEGESVEEKKNRDDYIIKTLGPLFFNILSLININGTYNDSLEKIFKELEAKTIANDNIAVEVDSILKSYSTMITDIKANHDFIELILVRHHTNVPFTDKLASVGVIKLPVAGPIGVSHKAPMSVGGIGSNSPIMTNRTRRWKKYSTKTRRAIGEATAMQTSQRDKADNTRKTIEDHIDEVRRLKIVVYDLQAYDVGYDIIDKLVPNIKLSQRYYSRRTNFSRNILIKLKDLLDDITRVKVYLNDDTKKRAQYALTNLLGMTDTKAHDIVNGISLRRSDAINELIATMGKQLYDTSIPKLQPQMLSVIQMRRQAQGTRRARSRQQSKGQFNQTKTTPKRSISLFTGRKTSKRARKNPRSIGPVKRTIGILGKRTTESRSSSGSTQRSSSDTKFEPNYL